MPPKNKPIIPGGIESPKDDNQKEKVKVESPFEVGKIYADVKVTRIDEDGISFKYPKRETTTKTINGKSVRFVDEVVRVPVYNKKGELESNVIVWEDIEHTMNPEDFARFIKARSTVAILTE